MRLATLNWTLIMLAARAELSELQRSLSPPRATLRLVDTPSHPRTLDLLAYWRERVCNGGFVVGKDIPHRRIARVLGNLSIQEPVENGTDLLVRSSFAPGLYDFAGEAKGRRLSTMLAADAFALNQKIAMQAITERAPLFGNGQLMRDNRVEAHIEIGWLPILSPDRQYVWLLNCVFHFVRPENTDDHIAEWPNTTH